MENDTLVFFTNYLQGREKSACTIRGYLQDLHIFGRWFEATNGEGLGPGNLTPTDIRLYRQYLKDSKAKPATINRRLAALRTYGAAILALGLAPDNPARGVRGVDQQKAAPKWLDKKEQAALTRQLERLQAAARTEAAYRQALRDRAAVITLLHTGLRVSELCAAELPDLALSERKGEIQVRAGKGEKARTVPLNKTAREALQAWLDKRGGGVGDRRIFTGRRGDDFTPSGLYRRIAEIGRLAGLELHPHTLRHTFAKNLVDAGVSLEKVAMLLGHASLEATRIYVTPSQRDLAAAVEILDL